TGVLPLPDVAAHVVEPRVAPDALDRGSDVDPADEVGVSTVALLRRVDVVVRIHARARHRARAIPLTLRRVGGARRGIAAPADLAAQSLPFPRAVRNRIAPIHAQDGLVRMVDRIELARGGEVRVSLAR